MIGMAGMNPSTWLRSDDQFLRGLMEIIAQRRVKIAADEREDLAVRIISTLAKAMKK